MHINESLGAYSGLISLALLAMNILLVLTVVHMRKAALMSEQAQTRQGKMNNMGVIGVGQRLLKIEQQLLSLNREQQDITDGHHDLAYSRARKLLQQGVCDDAVAASSGLSQAEVQLLKMIHQASHNVGELQTQV